MQINLSGHHVEVTDALRQYVGDKIKRIERHFDNVTDIQCILTVEKLEHKAEATIHVSGATPVSYTVDDNMYAAIDALTDKLDRQVKKHKEKATDHHARDSLKRNVS